MADFSSLNGYTVKDAIARNIAKGRNQALAYADYATMVETLNAMDNEQFKVGQNIYIGTVGVPDLWVYSVEPILHDYSHVSDEATVELLKNNGTIQVGYYKLAMLEGQKVDLTNVNAAIAENASAIAENASAISEQNKNLSKNLTRPDYSAITDITVLPSKPTINSTETFTCPDNGYISIYAYNAIQAGTMHLIINNFEVLLISGNVPNATSNIFIPVSKNDIVRLKTDMQTENWTIEQCRFIKMK